MAHGDYNCCAVCDSKLEYSNDAQTKEELCSWCAVNLAQSGVFVHNVVEKMDESIKSLARCNRPYRKSFFNVLLQK